MKKVFVYYDDGYYENGDVGFESFESRPEAENFVLGRMKLDEKASVDKYIVIEGIQLKLEVKEVVKGISIKD